MVHGHLKIPMLRHLVLAQGWFYRDLSIFGNNLIVGAPSYTIFNNRGYAYIYERKRTSWVPPVELLPSDSSVNDRFGYSVSAARIFLRWNMTDADTRMVHLDEGAVFFEKDGNGTWIEQSKLIPRGFCRIRPFWTLCIHAR